jgi:hypothetical protein
MRRHPDRRQAAAVASIRSAGVEVEDVSLPSGASSRVMVRFFRSEEAPRPAPVVVFLCEAVSGGAGGERDDRLLRAIAADTRATVLVPRPAPDPSGELESLNDLLRWIAQDGRRRWLDGTRVALVAGGIGAELCDRLSLLARERAVPGFRASLLLRIPDCDPATWHQAALFLATALRADPSPDGEGPRQLRLDLQVGYRSPKGARRLLGSIDSTCRERG